MISPVCHLLSKTISEKLDLQSTIKRGSYPFLCSHLNINVSTALFHTEKDVTYTQICIQRQKNGKYLSGVMSFCFYLNCDFGLKFTMYEGFSMMYSGMILTHRQLMNENSYQIINTSAYCNQKMFTHSRQSLKKGSKVSKN